MSHLSPNIYGIRICFQLLCNVINIIFYLFSIIIIFFFWGGGGGKEGRGREILVRKMLVAYFTDSSIAWSLILTLIFIMFDINSFFRTGVLKSHRWKKLEKTKQKKSKNLFCVTRYTWDKMQNPIKKWKKTLI